MKVQPLFICVDGSKDRDLPVSDYYVKGEIVTQYLDMCLLSNSTSEDWSWSLCTSVGIDNTSVNIGIRNLLKSRIKQQNPSVYFCGCPCHIIHNTAKRQVKLCPILLV